MISVPLLQSPISSRAQGYPGDDARICSFPANNVEDTKSNLSGEKITEENTKFAFSCAGQSQGSAPLTTQSMANQMLNPGVQLEFQSRRFNQDKTVVSDDLKSQSATVNTSQTSQNDGEDAGDTNDKVNGQSVDKIDAFDPINSNNLDQTYCSGLALKSDSDVRSAISNLVEMKKSAVSLLKKGNHDCHVDEQQTDGIRQTVANPAGLNDLDPEAVQGLNPNPLQSVSDLNRKETDTATASSSFVSVINSSFANSKNNYSKPYDDSCNKMKKMNPCMTTTLNRVRTSTLMKKPSYDTDADLLSRKVKQTIANNNTATSTRAQKHSPPSKMELQKSTKTDQQTELPNLVEETNATSAASDVALLNQFSAEVKVGHFYHITDFLEYDTKPFAV